MDWQDGVIQGVQVTELEVHEDDRGHLLELYRTDEISPRCTMGYWSATKPGVVRGPHEHEYQTDVFVFFPGFEVFLWDARKTSDTHGVRQKICVTEGSTRITRHRTETGYAQIPRHRRERTTGHGAAATYALRIGELR